MVRDVHLNFLIARGKCKRPSGSKEFMMHGSQSDSKFGVWDVSSTGCLTQDMPVLGNLAPKV